MAFSLVITPDHGWLLLVLVAIGLECFVIGFAVVARARKQVFNKEFMETHFGDLHFKETKTHVRPLGYPDMGNGRYSQKLSYKDWVYFNNAQRAHYNLVEQIAAFVIMTLIGGIVYPFYATIAGVAFFVGRLLYCFYVTKEGAAHPLRNTGALLGDFALLGAMGLSIMSAIKIIQS